MQTIAQMAEPATLKKMAEKLNLSISSVSRALKNHPRISQKTKKKVWDLAKKLDYQPNRMALNLLGKRTNTIGVIVPRISYHFYSETISGIEDEAIKSGFNIMICQSNESINREISNVHDLLSSQVDGIIVSLAAQTHRYDHFARILQKEVPLVFFNRVTKQLPAAKVYVNNFEAARQAVEHLISQGCEKIAFWGGPDYLYNSNERLKGYKAALADHNLPLDHSMIRHMDFSQTEGENQLTSMIEDKQIPDGIFAVSDTLAIGTMLAAKQAGLNIPEDLAIIGFNNDPVCQLLSPGLSSIDQDPYTIGQVAARMCLDQMDDIQAREAEQLLSTRLIIRQSSNRLNRID